MAIIINPISPVIFSIAGFDIRWYALAYVAAFILGGFLINRLMSKKDSNIQLDKKQFDDLFMAVVIGVILGGRLGYVIFYNFAYYIYHPLEILAIWRGGMSFHGGLIGVLFGVFSFAISISTTKDEKKPKIGRLHQKPKSVIWRYLRNTFKIMDLIAIVAPIGLFFGRIANFINMEVMGRETSSSFGVMFRGIDEVARHPSPLYEAATEGLLLFIIMICLYCFTGLRKRVGVLSGIFTMFYAVFRIICEFFRAPDAHIGFLTSWGLTMGQLLSVGMFVAGAIIFGIGYYKSVQENKNIA